MKKIKVKSALSIVMIALLFISCKNAVEEKKEDVVEANEKVVEAKNELKEAQLDSIKQYNDYKAEMDQKLTKNDNLMATIKEQINSDKKDIRMKSENELEVLKAKNEALKVKIKEHKIEAYDSWDTFKQNFNKEMDDLGKSISEMAQKNRKKT